jgi:malonyl-CoA/methylmalonyl-CoA synthetase
MADDLYSLIRSRAPALDTRFLETPHGRSLTYGQLFEAAGRFSNALVSLGVKPGDRVAAQVEKSPEVIALYLGCLRAGAVYLPLNTAYTAGELGYFFADAEPALIVCAPERVDEARALAPAGARVESLGVDGATGSLIDRVAQASPAFNNTPRTAGDLCAILYTSGTTGRSKGAMISHRNLASNALTLVDLWRMGPDDRLIHALPIYHTHGLFVAVNTVLLAGARMLYLPKFDTDQVIDAFADSTLIMGVPTFYTRLLDSPRLTPAACANMRLFISGSAPLLAETHAGFEARTGHKVLERYGMTETNMITSNPYDGDRRAGTVGFPLPEVSVRIADAETGALKGVGEIGVIEVKGPNVFGGYWRMPEKTAQEFRADGYFITGDLGVIDADGYVSIVGRAKDLIISGGLNVYPKEVEEEIDALEGVVESAVIGVPHPNFGEAVVAVVARAKTSSLDEAAVLAALAGRLARFKQPKRVVFVDDLPRNAMGKVQKAELRKDYAGVLN